MRCNWSKSISSVFRNSTHHGRHRVSGVQSSLTASHSIWSAPVACRRAALSILAANRSYPQPEPITVNSPLPSGLLTHAQMSRAASQAVRLSIQNHRLTDAYLIVNSLRCSGVNPDDLPEDAKIPGLRQSVRQFKATNAIYFGQEVSPRLSSHTLLHGLIRIGLSHKAFTLSKLMMQSGIRLRSATLEAVIQSLLPHTPRSLLTPFNSHNLAFLKLAKRQIRPEEVHEHMSHDRNTQFALLLLNLARKSRNRRTNGMFNMLICACLFNGEIILASLIFGLMLKDLQLKTAITAQALMPSEAKVDIEQPKGVSQPQVLDLRSEPLTPDLNLMISIVASGRALLEKEEPESLEMALQVLANLAQLIDNRQLPFGNLSFLLSTLYRCPKSEGKVQVMKRGSMERVVLEERVAHEYIHDVLRRLIDNLPHKPPPRPPPIALLDRDTPRNESRRPELGTHPGTDVHIDMLHPLNRSTYNSLLHYALLIRQSPALGKAILHHMTEVRHRPLQPGVDTYNILLRTGTLLRRPEFPFQALEALLNHPDNKVLVPGERIDDIKTSFCLSRTNVKMLEPTSQEHSSLHADLYTLSSYIIHLSITNQRVILHDLISRIFPEMRDQLGHTGTREGRTKQQKWPHFNSVCVDRGVALGPYFFTTLLTALKKIGSPLVMASVWKLAKLSEEASWISGTGVRPWFLPVHAYTTMLLHHASQVRKFFQRFKRGVPQARQMHKVSRWRAENAYKRMMKIRDQYSFIKDLKPDAWFFNAALKVFAPRRQTKRRLSAFYRRGLRFAHLQYAESGRTSNAQNGMLKIVVEGMIQARVPIPPALRASFVGVFTPANLAGQPREPSLCRPMTFRRRRRPCSPFYLETHKTRGLPRRRRKHNLTYHAQGPLRLCR